MKKFLISSAILLSITVLALAIFYSYFSTTASEDYPYDGSEPDIPAFIKGKVSKEEFMLRRAEGIALKRGIDKNKPLPNPKIRQTAILKMERQQEALAKMPESDLKESLTAAWSPIGPSPIPNGQVAGPNPMPVSGRVSAIAVHPTNPNIVYVGTASGGLYRTTDGGTNWAPIMDNAMSLAIGAVAIAPSQPETIYVGTGEGAFGADSFFGVGIYRINNASGASPVITGPLNKNSSNQDIFTGQSISKIIVHPTDPATIFAATVRGWGGIGGFDTQGGATPRQGIYRSRNATAANTMPGNPTFGYIGPLSPFSPTFPDVRDIAIDPVNPARMVAVLAAVGNGGGLYSAIDALDLGPQFSQDLSFNAPSPGSISAATGELAVVSGATGPVFYAATGVGNGTVYRSVGGFIWTQQIDNDFCGGQCDYNIAIAVDPTNVNRVYLGGLTNSRYPNALTFGISNNNVTAFTRSENGLHSDTHAIAVAPSSPSIIYVGTDGGISKSTDSGANWTSLNNSQFSATQFMSIAVHPTDPNFSIGGTQDNGTNFYQPQGTWTRADHGDGGYALIDQNATDTTNVRMYHTYFNLDNTSGGALMGYGTVSNTAQARDNGWAFRGCDSANPNGNGISCSDTDVNFYAPLARGPGNPNPIYFGTDRLYRSTDAGATHQPASQTPITAGVAISAIGISPQNDNFRIVGQRNGGIWGTKTGSMTLSNLDTGNRVPPNYIARAVIDPNNAETAYVTLSAFGVVSVWKTTNFTFSEQPDWTAAAGSGSTAIPQVPVSAFLVDPTNSNTLYAGTDMGVYISTNGGAAWMPFGTGLPHVAVFDMAITPGTNRKLRIATHGRGMFEIPLSEAPQPRISINDVSLNEGNNGTRDFTFNVTLSIPISQTVTVNYATADDSATTGSDYAGKSGTVTFNPGETSKPITILVNGDTTVEPTEVFRVNLTGSTNAIIANGQGNGFIINDDGAISINDVTLNEGNTSTTAFTFNITLSAAVGQAVTVNYATANDSATAGSDYAASTGIVTFNPGETSKQITVLVNGDTTVEPNEIFRVNLSGATGAAIANDQGVGLILNDDTMISINDVTLNEGNSGTTAFTFNVTLSASSSQTVTVSYATANNSAIAPGDYTSVPATTLTFNPTETTKQITVLVNGDTTVEQNENFHLNLSGATNAVISDNQGIGTILNDDTSISINEISLSEGNSGTTAFTFNVTLSAASSQTVTVNYATDDGSATASSDYAGKSGTVTFNPNETSKQITILVNGDTTVEQNENFFVNLSGATNATIADNQGVGTIINDEGVLPSLSINDVSLIEGDNSNITTSFIFNVTLSAASSQTVTVDFATANGTATAGSDYITNTGTLTFNPNEASKTIIVQANGDTTIEQNENFFVNLSAATNALIADNQGIGTIVNDDSTPPSISVNNISLNEGNSGTTAFTFTVSLSSANSQPITVNYATADGTAVALGDYIAIPPTTLLTFGAGETSKQISVSVIGDTMPEPNENFTVNLSNPSNAIISDNQGVGTIINDDGCSYAINPTSQNFPVSGGSNTIQVTAPGGCAWTAVSNNSFADSLSSVRNQSRQSENNNFIASLTANINELFAPSSITAVFSNSAPITIPDSGTATLYPSNITVSGMTGTITDLNVKINNLSHSFPDDIAMLLVSPDGNKKFILQSDSGGGVDVVSLTYTFDDQAASSIPDDGPMPANNGSVKPSSIRDDDEMPAPAPDTPYSQPASAGTATLNGTFGGISPNGTWKLFVIDFFAGDDGNIGGGWSLDITTQGGASNFITITSAQNGNGNGTVAYSVGQNTTGQTRTGTMTIAGQTFTVNQSNTQTRRAFDFDGDGKSDVAVFRPDNGAWYLLNSSSGFTGVSFGISTDKIVPADYDGDGKADIAVFRNGNWYMLRSQLGFTGVGFGIAEDIPVPADYDGDGKDDIAVFRPSNGAWYLLQSTGGFTGIGFGQNGDKPVAGDYDGDRKADLAVYRNGVWYLQRSNLGFTGVQFGESTDKAVAGDYDGDGKADIAVFRPSTGAWYLLQSTTGFAGVGFGISTDLPAPADFDGDGKTDIAVFRDGNWYLLRSQQGFTAVQFGIANDKPVLNAFVP